MYLPISGIKVKHFLKTPVNLINRFVPLCPGGKMNTSDVETGILSGRRLSL
jgi:hypothetical protein